MYMAVNSVELTPLMIACQENDMKKVEEILNKDKQASSSVDGSGKVSLHHCAERGDLEMFKKVFDSDPSVIDKRDEDGYTPLTFAVIGGNGPVVDLLIEKGADINNVDSERHSLIHWATVCGHAEILTKLLINASLPSTPDLHGAHALHYATQTATVEPQTSTSTTTIDGVEILKILLKHGASVNCTDFEDRTPLLWAASSGNSAAVVSLLEAGADKHARDKDKLTALHCAASRGHGDVIRTICKAASDVQVNARDRNGSSPIFYAAALGHVDAVKALLEMNAIADLQDNKLRTAAHCAAARGQLGPLKVLRQHGASFALENYRGDLPIHEACQAGSLEIIDWLSISPNYVNSANHNGRTPLHLAAALGHLDACRLLVEKGANKDALMLSKSACVTALDLAEEKGHEDVVEYLKSVGAQKCNELTPPTIVEEFKKRILTRRLSTAKGSRRGKNVTESQAQTEETLKTDKAVATGHESREELALMSNTERDGSEEEENGKEDAKAATEALLGSQDNDVQNKKEEGKGKGKGAREEQRDGEEKGERERGKGKGDKGDEGEEGEEGEVAEEEEAGEEGETGRRRGKSGGGEEEEVVETEAGKGEGEGRVEEGRKPAPGKGRGREGRKGAEKVKEKLVTKSVGKVTQSKTDTTTEKKKEKKHNKRKSKKEITSETQSTGKAKHIQNGSMDSSRTSANVSEIATTTENGERKKQRSIKITVQGEEDDAEGDKDEEEAEEERSMDEEERDQVGSEISSENSSGKIQLRKSNRFAHGPSLNLSSFRGSDSDRQSTDRPIDRFRVDWESSLRSSVHRYAEEKRIFQELANLKRLQIQYGNVQEDVIVRRLIDDFLRGYNIKHGDFQVNTFNAWEKFLYDQLKILYRKEKDALMQTYESKVKNQASLFDQKHAAGIGRRRRMEDHIDRLSRTYGIAPIPMQYSPRLYKATFMSHNL